MEQHPIVTVRPALEAEVPLILQFIQELAAYERLSDAVVATEADLRATLFGPQRYAQTLFGCVDGAPVGFAVYFFNYSTFLGRPGLYLEDLYVRPQARGQGVGRRLLGYLAHTAVERGCGRLEWAVLDWNEPALRFYRTLGALPASGWLIHRLTGSALTGLARGV
jgi:GNAT superfamily N-acetyltransferase